MLRRRTVLRLSVASATAVCVAAALWFRPMPQLPQSYARCRETGGVLSEEGRRCTDRAGAVHGRDDAVVLVGVSLPFSFAYPGRLSVRLLGDGVALSGSGEILRVRLFPSSAREDEVLRSSLTTSGSLSVLHAAIGGTAALLAIPVAPGLTDAALVIPLKPPRTFRGRTVNVATVVGTRALVMEALDSLAFIPVNGGL